MEGAAQPGNHAALGEDGLDHGDVVQMASAVIAIIGNQHIARRKPSHRVALQHDCQGTRHGADKRRHRTRRLRELPPAAVHQSNRHIPIVTHDGGEGGADKTLRRFIHEPRNALPGSAKPKGRKAGHSVFSFSRAWLVAARHSRRGSPLHQSGLGLAAQKRLQGR